VKVLVVCNMWPEIGSENRGIFVAEQVQSLKDKGLQVETLYIDTRGNKSSYGRFLPELWARTRRDHFDLIHAHYGLVGAALAPWRAHPVLVTFHGSDVYIPWQRRISKLGAKAATKSIFVSRTLREAMGVPGEVIPCGIDLSVFSPRSRSESQKKFGIDPDRPAILFPASRNNPAKGWPLFEEALKHLPLAPQIVEMKGIPRLEVASLLAAVDVMVVTSHYEGGPIVVKEALACGLPVVTVPVGEVCERLRGVDGCAIVPRKAEALASAIETALHSRLRRLKPDFERIQQLSLSNVADDLIAVYESTQNQWRAAR